MEIRHRVKRRALLVAVVFIVCFLGLSVRMWWIQSVQADWIMARAKAQWEMVDVLQPKRGSILDRNGNVLAYEGKAYSLSAQLKPKDSRWNRVIGENYVKDPYGTAVKLAPILGVSVDELYAKLTQTSSPFVDFGFAGRKITEEQRQKIYDLQYPLDANGKRSETNQLPGIILKETSRRYYPNHQFASHVLGYLTFDDKAEMGIEKQFDEELRGEPGEIRVLTDRIGYLLPEGEETHKPAKNGLDVVLTIDQEIQTYVEQALDKAEQEYKPKKMTVIVTDPNTGEILAMANRPQFDPNQYWNITNWDNHAISMNFEPGSTFKIITLAAAIEEGKFNASETYQSGYYQNVPGRRIQDHNGGKGWGKITFLEGVQRSSNVAFVILGYERLGAEKLAQYYDKFGMGKKTGITLPGEARGTMLDIKNARSKRDIAVTTFGQGILVTAIQQVAAVGAIANGGELLKPYIVKEFRHPDTHAVVQRNSKQLIRRVVSEKTAKEVRDILETVVTSEAGTGQAFKVEGYRVAGKTGTAQKYDEQTGKILEGRYIYSFIGFAPKDDPRLLVYVVVDDPQTDMPYGEVGRKVVAPIFNSIMEKSLHYLQEQPDLTQVTKTAPVVEKQLPDLIGQTGTYAENRLREEGFAPLVIGTGTRIVKQIPQPYEKAYPGTKVYLLTDRLEGVKMPDFKGSSLREVMEFAGLAGLKVKAVGSGFIVEQSIPPGTVLKGNETITVKLEASLRE